MSIDVSSFPIKPQQSSKDEDDEYEDLGGDDLGMDWGGYDDDNWEDDGSYCEHGREIFDEEAEATAKDKKGKAKKPGMPKRVAKPTSNIKHMLLNAGNSSKKKKQEKVSLEGDELLNDLLLQAKQPKRPHPSATPTHTSSRSASFTPRLSSTPQVPRPHMAKKIRVTKSHDGPTISAGSAAIKRFSKSADVSSFPIKPQQSSKDEDNKYEDVGGDDLGMDWGGCDDDNWEDGDAREGMRGGGGDSVRPSTADDAPGGGVVMATKKEEGGYKEEAMMEEEKTVVPEAAVSVSGWETVRDELEETKNAFGGVQVDSSLPT